MENSDESISQFVGDSIKRLAKEWIRQLDENNAKARTEELLNIKRIDGIKVQVTRTVNRELQLLLIEVNSVEIEEDFDDEYNSEMECFTCKAFKFNGELNELTLACAIIKARSWLSTLKYHSLTELKEPNGSDDEFIVFDLPNIKQAAEKCCVCHENTNRKTDCEHHLCLQCYYTLEPEWLMNCQRNRRHHHVKCPICRKITHAAGMLC